MNNLDQELDSILHKIGTDINKVYSSNPVGPWCMNHYFKLIKGECVGCEAKQAIQALISDQVAKARIEETKLYKQYFKGRTQGYANARIDVLEKELATKRSKE